MQQPSNYAWITGENSMWRIIQNMGGWPSEIWRIIPSLFLLHVSWKVAGTTVTHNTARYLFFFFFLAWRQKTSSSWTGLLSFANNDCSVVSYKALCAMTTNINSDFRGGNRNILKSNEAHDCSYAHTCHKAVCVPLTHHIKRLWNSCCLPIYYITVHPFILLRSTGVFTLTVTLPNHPWTIFVGK